MSKNCVRRMLMAPLEGFTSTSQEVHISIVIQTNLTNFLYLYHAWEQTFNPLHQFRILTPCCVVLG